MESGEEIGILGVEVGPDRQHILVEGGSAVNFVLNPTTGQKLKLPLTPPGANMLGFGWRWIGETKLWRIRVQPNTKGAPMSCEGTMSLSQALRFDVTTQKSPR